MHVCANSRLDYFKVLLFGLPKKALDNLQISQNATVCQPRLEREYTLYYSSPHWFLVSLRINMIIILLVE